MSIEYYVVWDDDQYVKLEDYGPELEQYHENPGLIRASTSSDQNGNPIFKEPRLVESKPKATSEYRWVKDSPNNNYPVYGLNDASLYKLQCKYDDNNWVDVESTTW